MTTGGGKAGGPEADRHVGGRHHYVPRFYLGRFTRPEAPTRVMTYERHRDLLVGQPKSIDSIGYEDGLHDFAASSGTASIEGKINELVETPFSASTAWTRIKAGHYDRLDARDGLAIYAFARHLKRRNLETLRFVQAEHERWVATAGEGDFGRDEILMHRWIVSEPGGGHALFRRGTLDVEPPLDAGDVDVMICISPVPLRTSTNPVLPISHPGVPTAFGSFFERLRTWWLPLDRRCGVFIVAGGPAGFSVGDMQVDAARLVNRLYFAQQQESLSVRYVLADDLHVADDLDWIGYDPLTGRPGAIRYRRRVPPG